MDFHNKITEYIRKVSGFRSKQDYLGMSTIANCSRLQYDQYMDGQVATDSDHLNCLRGGVIEEAARQHLIGAGIMKPQSQKELTFMHNGIKYQGHTDGKSVEDDWMEIKSLRKDKFDKIKADQRIPYYMNGQAQTYMYHDPEQRVKAMLFFFICPETFEFFFLRVVYNHGFAKQLHAKALRILNAIHFKERPVCDCNRNCQ